MIPDNLRKLRCRLIIGGTVVIERHWTRERDGLIGLVRMLHPMFDAAVDARDEGRPWQMEMIELDMPTFLGTVRYGSDPANMDDPIRVPGRVDEIIYVDGEHSAVGWHDGIAAAIGTIRALAVAAIARNN